MFFKLFFVFCSVQGLSLDLKQVAPQVSLKVLLTFRSNVLDQGNGQTFLSMETLLESCESPDSDDLCSQIKTIDLKIRSPLLGQKVFIKESLVKDALSSFGQGHLDLHISFPKEGITVYSQTTRLLAFQIKEQLTQKIFPKESIRIVSLRPESIDMLGQKIDCLDMPKNSKALDWDEKHQTQIYLAQCEGFQGALTLTIQKEMMSIIKKGDPISVLYELDSGLQISSHGTALKSGSMGEEIPVQISFSKKELQGKIEGPRQVLIKGM